MLPRSKSDNDFLEHIIANFRKQFGSGSQRTFMVGAKLNNDWIDMESLKPLTFMRWYPGNLQGIQLSIENTGNSYGV